MTKTNYISGTKYNNLTLLNYAYVKNNKTYWSCKCECGVEKIIQITNVKSGHTKSCGCKNKSRFQDLVGIKYKHLTVISLAESVRKQKTWNCVCDCGNMTKVATGDLKSGNTKSCGCKKHKEHFENLVGKKFGKITVISINGKNKRGRVEYKTLCDCGKEIIISSENLKKKKNKSCGCVLNKSRLNDLTGKVFGKLTVTELSHTSTNGAYWKVKCNCGIEKVKLGKNLIRGLVNSCGCNLKGMNIKNLTGQTFGQLTVLSYSHTTGRAYWNVKCSCGRNAVKMGTCLLNGSVGSCGCRQRHFTEFGSIYGILNDNKDVVYVGQTIRKDIEHRLEEHLHNPVSKKMREWLNSINYKPEIKCIMKNVPLEVLNYAEKKAIKFFHKKHELNNTNNLL